MVGNGQEIRFRMGIVGTHPGSSHKSGKHRTYRIRNLEEYTENGMQESYAWREDGPIRVLSDNHT
jgi:hypothetical protein